MRRPAAGNLHDGAIRFASQAYRQRRTDDSFTAHHGDFHAAAITGDDYHRSQATVQKVSVADFLASLVEDLPVVQYDWLEVRAQAGKFFGYYC